MSFTGKLKRGYKWYTHRNAEGELPSAILDDPNKMVDVKLYLDYIKGKNSKSVNKKIIKLRHLNRTVAKNKELQIKELVKELENPKKAKPKKVEEPVKVVE